jgi:hypothetical protein
VNKLLKNLDITKAIGPDLIPSRVLKEAADQIKPFLTRIFNQTLESGEARERHWSVVDCLGA